MLTRSRQAASKRDFIASIFDDIPMLSLQGEEDNKEDSKEEMMMTTRKRTKRQEEGKDIPANGATRNLSEISPNWSRRVWRDTVMQPADSDTATKATIVNANERISRRTSSNHASSSAVDDKIGKKRCKAVKQDSQGAIGIKSNADNLDIPDGIAASVVVDTEDDFEDGNGDNENSNISRNDESIEEKGLLLHSQLIRAINSLDLAAVQALLNEVKASGLKLADFPGALGQKVLIAAIIKRQVRVVEIALEHGVDVNDVSALTLNPIHWATHLGERDIVLLLLRHNSMVDSIDSNGWTALMLACHKGRLDIMQDLFSANASYSVPGSADRTVLMIACAGGFVEIVRYLLVTLKVDANTVAGDGATALMWAARNGNLEVVNLLIDHNASVNNCDREGSSALGFASEAGHLAIVERLIACNADISSVDREHTTPLMLAAYKGHTACVSALFKSGADINARDIFNWNALLWAAREGHTETVRELMRFGATPIEDAGRRNTLMWACRQGHVAMVRELLDNDPPPDISVTDSQGLTALLWAARGGHIEVYDMLVQRGADANAKDSRQQSALLFAIANNHPSMVEHLLKLGADIDCTNEDGDSLLQIAMTWPADNNDAAVESENIRRRKLAILKILLSRGLVWNVEDPKLKERLLQRSRDFQVAVQELVAESMATLLK